MKSTSKWTLLTSGVVGIAATAFLAGRALAGGIPATGALTYSGLLQGAAGVALSGSHPIRVSFWNAASGGTTPLCQTASSSIALDAGRFSVALPDTCTNAVRDNADAWAEVEVDGVSLGRTKLGAVPYAVEAARATSLTCPENPTAPSKFGFCIWHEDNGTRYSQDHKQAAATCAAKGARLCSFAEVSAAWHAGANWCAVSWVADLPAVTNADVTSGYGSYPIQTNGSGCHNVGVDMGAMPLTNKADANCCK